MSLVNDALKRAKEAQRKAQPEAPAPPFRPPDPAAAPARGLDMLVPIVIAAIALVALVVVLQNRQKTIAREAAVQPLQPAPVAAVQKTTPPVQPAAAPVAAPSVTAAVAEKPAPAPAPAQRTPEPPLKLQAIFYSPGRSSAMINGKSIKVGDVYKGFRVAAITQTSATLVSATQTNVMTLEQD
jgi:hypothetical protein